MNIQFLGDYTLSLLSEFDENDNPTHTRNVNVLAGQTLEVEFVESDLESSVVITETDEVIELTSDQFESIFAAEESPMGKVDLTVPDSNFLIELKDALSTNPLEVVEPQVQTQQQQPEQ